MVIEKTIAHLSTVCNKLKLFIYKHFTSMFCTTFTNSQLYNLVIWKYIWRDQVTYPFPIAPLAGFMMNVLCFFLFLSSLQ